MRILTLRSKTLVYDDGNTPMISARFTTIVKRYWPDLFFLIIASALTFRLFRLSVSAASDFEVYWYAIHAWVEGKNPYLLYSPVYTGLVFKYPPWILPLFLPFAWMSLDLSKWIWTIAQVLAIGYSSVWLIRCGIHRRIVFLTLLMFWWMWLAHAYFGQIMVFLLAFALWSCSRMDRNELKTATLSFLFTSKVFSLVSLLGIWRRVLKPKTILYGISFLLLAHLTLLMSFPNVKASNLSKTIPNLYRDWVHAATSGGADLGATIVRGQQNHGFVAAILRNLHVEATQIRFDIGVALVLAICFSLLWNHFSKKLTLEEKWSGWLAIGVIAHPLAWHHSFVMTFPLCAFAIQRAYDSQKWFLVGLAVLGTSCIGLLIPQVIGVDAVVPLETLGSKSWGALFCALSLFLSQRHSRNLNC